MQLTECAIRFSKPTTVPLKPKPKYPPVPVPAISLAFLMVILSALPMRAATTVDADCKCERESCQVYVVRYEVPKPPVKQEPVQGLW